jgi:hypothetical protein
MDFVVHSHRHGETLLETLYGNLWNELKKILTNITDDDLEKQFSTSKSKKSLSTALNDIIRERFVVKGWTKEAPIFQDPEYTEKADKAWRLDFAKQDISIEVSFNHGESLAWNLTKPVLASEYNHVKKAIQTKIGVIILATDEMKKAGAFDGAVGSYEKAIRYLKPMNQLLIVPVVLIGLKAPKLFKITTTKTGNSYIGHIEKIK